MNWTFPEDQWKDCDKYYLNLAPQGSEAWLESRRFRLTASNVGKAIGLCNFSTSEQIADSISEIKKIEFTDNAKRVMAHGTEHEPIARKWYEEQYSVTVTEVGLAVPKWNYYLGASLDGSVDGTRGMIEIKCPLQMYKPLLNKPENTTNYNHIWKTHYAQMQTCMLVCDKDWTDYIVYSTESEKVYIERIPLDRKYCDEILLPGINNFINNLLIPRIRI